ncbi:DedA family protein [Cellulomonas carbonis]|uniref:Alanine dehydrogenase n=1 Tax=Cellulomonas carbonis T26 TaxID=947969 RepID=A0A0A0BS92_9CELL|nr:DedA family protein [Cellulomonas carbonis]KGM10542.1 alanine dehydrogenase [Cellulomonas carbonis T26]GGC02221.1 DedA family protein [Cellulomonas carbonis]
MLLAASSDPSRLTGLAGWVVDTIELLGPWGVGLLVALETVFPPIPSEVVLPVSGFLAGQGRMSVVAAVVGATAGSLLGAGALYAIGARLGVDRLHRVIDRAPLVDHEDLDRARSWFDRHGSTAVLTGRFVPVVRSLVSVPAGVERMPVARFLLLTGLGSAVYNGVLVGAGYLLGGRWTDVGRYSDLVNAVLIGGLVALVGWFVVKRLRSRRHAPAGRGSGRPSTGG